MTLDLHALKGNLVELHAWAKSPSSADLEDLIPNADLTRIYYAGYLMGKAWKVYYRFRHWMTGKEILPECRQKTLDSINAAFILCQEQACADNKLFLDSSICLQANEPGHPNSAAAVKERIMQACLTIQPFLKTFEENTAGTALRRLGIAEKPSGNDPNLLSQGLILLESLTGARFPLNAVHKLAMDGKLTRFEELQLKSYLAKLRDPNGIGSAFAHPSGKYLVEVRFFHRLLKQIVEAFHRQQGDAGARLPSLDVLEDRLEGYGFDLFLQEDPQHLAWRRALPGKKVKVGNERMAVGHQIGVKREGPDRYALFALPQAPHLLLKTGMNEARLGIDRFRIEKAQFGIPYAATRYRDPKQRFALVERVVKTLGEEMAGYRRSPGQWKALYPFQDLFDGLKKLRGTPSPLSPDAIGFTADGRIRTFHQLRRGPADPGALERFAFACSGEDHAAYADLMVCSRLFSTQAIQFYHQVLVNTLKGSPWPLLLASFSQWVFNAELKRKGEDFALQVQKTREACLAEVSASYVIKDQLQLREMVDYCITAYHREKCIGSYLRPAIVHDVCAMVADYLKLPKKSVVGSQ